MRILIVEDEKKVANALREGLQAEHYEVEIAATGEEGFFLASQAFSELLARIRALLRRGRIDQILKLQHEDLEMDLVTHKVSRGAQGLELTTKEFDLLEFLLRHSGSVVSREMLARDVWHATIRATPLDNVIDVTIARLRRKIDEPYERKLLHTVRGLGYILSGRYV